MKTGFSDAETTPQATAEPHSCPTPLALILSDHEPSRLGKLALQRSKAALPFAGEYRLIDFALSNCVHSGIETIGVVTQYQPRSLHTHLAYGRPWDLDKRHGGLTLLHPYQGHTGMRWYGGTADAIYQNQDFIHRQQTEHVLILAGDQIYKLDFNALIAQHCKNKADLTLAAVAVNEQEARRHNTLVVDQEGWVQDLVPPQNPSPGSLAMMGVMLFSADVLNWRLGEDQSNTSSTHNLERDVIPHMIRARDRIQAYQYTGYWNPIRTAQDYWHAGMDLLSETPSLNLQDAGWPILTQVHTRPPTRVAVGARVSHTLLSGGCIIEGTVEYAILSPGVYVGPGAIVRNSIVMHNTTIEECAQVQNAILDMETTIGQQAQIGMAHRHAPTLSVQTLEPLTIIEKGAHIRTGVTVRPSSPEQEAVVHAARQVQVDRS
jgi:glucose-1-phosphate adenylyltransferase